MDYFSLKVQQRVLLLIANMHGSVLTGVKAEQATVNFDDKGTMLLEIITAILV